MSTEQIQINLAQKIFSIDDEGLLKKINILINDESVMGFVGGAAVSTDKFIREMDEYNADIDAGKAEFFSTSEVFNSIKNAHGLA